MDFLTSLASAASLGAGVSFAIRRARTAANGASTPEPQVDLEAAWCAEMVRRAASSKRAAITFHMATGRAGPCRFTGVATGQVELSMPDAPFDADGVKPGDIVLVQFNADGRSRVFAAPVEQCVGDGLSLGMPERIADAQTPGAYRFPLTTDILPAAVLHGEEVYDGHATELDARAVRVRFAADAIPPLTEGQETEVRLIHAGREVQRSARVVDVDAPMLALSLDTGEGDDPSPPERAYHVLLQELSERA